MVGPNVEVAKLRNCRSWTSQPCDNYTFSAPRLWHLRCVGSLPGTGRLICLPPEGALGELALGFGRRGDEIYTRGPKYKF